MPFFTISCSPIHHISLQFKKLFVLEGQLKSHIEQQVIHVNTETTVNNGRDQQTEQNSVSYR